MLLKKILKPPYRVLLRLVNYTFYDKKYLTGRKFTKDGIGWIWGMRNVVAQKIKGINRHIPWPVSPFMTVAGPAENIIFHPDNMDNFQGSGGYFQCFAAKIYIGRGTYIANNVGLITANHDLLDPDEHLPGKDIIIGEKCWIGMNAVVLPGVTLGDHTVVGAGSVVTKSFPQGYCVIAGNPAKMIKELEKREN